MNCCKSVKTNVGRGIMWKLRGIELTENEISALNQSGIHDEIMQKYLAWRKSTLLMAACFAAANAGLTFVDIASFDVSGLNGFGIAAYSMNYVSPVVLAIVLFASSYLWARRPHASFRILSYGWIVSMILPLWPLVVPVPYLTGSSNSYIESLYDDDDDDYYDDDFSYDDDEIVQLADFALRAIVAVDYAIQIFPIAISVPSGIIRGALRVRGLLPECTLAGWLIVISTPIYPLVVLIALVTISQVLGSYLLMIGAVFLMIPPALYIFRRNLYTKPRLTPSETASVDRNQRIIGCLTLIGIGFIAVWGLVEAELEFTADQMIAFVVSFLTRVLAATVFFADIALRMTASNLVAERAIREGSTIGETDSFLKSFEKEFEKARLSLRAGRLDKDDQYADGQSKDVETNTFMASNQRESGANTPQTTTSAMERRRASTGSPSSTQNQGTKEAEDTEVYGNQRAGALSKNIDDLAVPNQAKNDTEAATKSETVQYMAPRNAQMGRPQATSRIAASRGPTSETESLNKKPQTATSERRASGIFIPVVEQKERLGSSRDPSIISVKAPSGPSEPSKKDHRQENRKRLDPYREPSGFVAYSKLVVILVHILINIHHSLCR